MSTSKEFLNYVLEQLKDIPEISFKPMMGEYLLYYRGKLVGDICDNCIFIEPVSAAEKLLPNAQTRPPYKGAKDMIVLEDFEDVRFVKILFEEMYSELPVPKRKNKKV